MQDALAEPQRDTRYPISRWYVRPMAGWAARRLSETVIRPGHLTALGLMMAAGAVVVLWAAPEHTAWAAIPVWLAWFCDRADGMLARRQGTVSAWGAWFDANIDELTDLAFQTAVAAALAWQVQAAWPWFLLIAFLVGKYLLMYGLAFEEQNASVRSVATGSDENSPFINARGQAPPLTKTRGQACQSGSDPSLTKLRLLQKLYHLPGNCDVRIHWLIVMLLLDQLAVELAAVAVYYNLRWIARYAILWRRLGRQR